MAVASMACQKAYISLLSYPMQFSETRRLTPLEELCNVSVIQYRFFKMFQHCSTDFRSGELSDHVALYTRLVNVETGNNE